MPLLTTELAQEMDEATTLEVWELSVPEDAAVCNCPWGCAATAEWALVARPCSHNVGTLCTTHWVATREWWALCGRARCNHCGAVATDLDWHRI